MSALTAMLAALATGLFLGVVLAATFAILTRSRVQKRVERELLNWRSETIHAREAAEQLVQGLDAREGRPKSPTGREW